MGVKRNGSSLVLEGANLGKRHKCYNDYIKEATASKQETLTPINMEHSDIDNLINVDIASNNKNVEYISTVLKCEDMLYVSRAIKRCTWLITDNEYAHIVNPQYLHTQLFPEMTSRAINKFMLHVRLNLKEEARVEQFFNYYYIDNKSLKTALKWLPRCSINFIKDIIQKHAKDINISLFKRICKITPDPIGLLDLYIRHGRDKIYILTNMINLLGSHTDKYLDFVESLKDNYFPYFGIKATNIIMKKNPQRIINNFTKYAKFINVPAFAKSLKRDTIKDFLLKHMENQELQFWYNYDNIKHFIKYMPVEGRFEFLKQVFIDKNAKVSPPSTIFNCLTISNANVYIWYKYATFDIAFPELQKMIRKESSPDERNSMLSVLLHISASHMPHLRTLLQYYNDRHINEAFKFKNQFINNVISQTNVTEYDEDTWSILNNIFHSMEVYIESENNVQTCVEYIILYNVIHKKDIPEIIEEKFIFNTFIKHKEKLNEEQIEMLFNYLHSYMQRIINRKNISDETEFIESIVLVQETLTLLSDWKKEMLDYPWLRNKIIEFIRTKKENEWNVSFVSLYYALKKSWRKHLFEESLALNPTETTFMNALKHDPEVLNRNRRNVEEICSDDKVSLKQVLSKLRIYWPQTLAKEWAVAYFDRIHQRGGRKALTHGLCALLQQQELHNLLEKYKPDEDKIKWSETDQVTLSMRKYFAKNMHRARPQPSLDVVMMYTRGDYLQFALPSLNAVFYNMSSVRCRTLIRGILQAPVSLQKHGIRFAFQKLDSEETKLLFSVLWNSTKNASIRAVLFKHTYDLLCKEKKAHVIKEIWEMLSVFIDNLSLDENKIIVDTLHKIEDVPLEVRANYCMKSYTYLNSLPAKANCEGIIDKVKSSMVNIMELIDSDFIANVLTEFYNTKYDKMIQPFHRDYIMFRLMSSYLLCSTSEYIQTLKFEMTFALVMKQTITHWNEIKDNKYYMRHNLVQLLNSLAANFRIFVLKKSHIFPVNMFKFIQNELEVSLDVYKNYVMLRSWKLTVEFVKILEKNKSLFTDIVQSEDKTIWNDLYEKCAPEFGIKCAEILEEDVQTYLSTVYLLFSKAFEDVFEKFSLYHTFQHKTLMSMLETSTIKETSLLALNIWQRFPTRDSKELPEKIISHPSQEVKMHYYEMVKFIPTENV